ncbi:MAG: DNA-protecting protein DprA [Bacteroidetes bacterium]|nr:DNA-protecting protein DprA [Bacteroidota bacterium]
MLVYKIALSLIPSVGDRIAKKLVSYCGSVEAVFNEKKSNLLKIPGIGEIVANSVIKQKVLARAEEEVLFIEKHNITPVFYLDDNYPNRLKHCSDSPLMLYYKGNADLNHEKIIAIVGTRNATEYGKKCCIDLVADLVPHNPIIISGLAYGIDICAHKASLENGLKTIGVMAHGLDRIYPNVHKSVSKKMAEQGGLITDYMSQTNPDRENFPSRNRIIAGMADAVIVVEAAKKGGALITADIANSYNRDVFAFPGRIGDEYSAGCNHLIKINRAALIQSAADIEYLMGWTKIKEKKSVQKKLFVELSSDEQILFDILNTEGNKDIDYLSFKSNLPMSKASALLLGLEFKGMVNSLPGKVYKVN